jgi:hypothetical protein
MHFTAAEARLIAIHARRARPLHETVRALADALPDATPHRILALAQLAIAPDSADRDSSSTTQSDTQSDSDSDTNLDPANESDNSSDDDSDDGDASSDDDPDADGDDDDGTETVTANHADDRVFQARMARDPMVLGLNRAISQLRGQRNSADSVRRVDTAIAAGQLIPAQRAWALAYCSADPHGFRHFLANQPVMPLAEPGTPNAQITPPAASQSNTLSEAETQICALTRTNPDKFLTRRARTQALMAARPVPGSIIRLELD